MFDFGGNVLAEHPKRFLPRSAILVYRRSDPAVLKEWAEYGPRNATDYVQVASVNNTRMALWDVLILRSPRGGLFLEITESSWAAFKDLPELFAELAEKPGRSWRKPRMTVDDAIEMLKRLGAVEQLS